MLQEEVVTFKTIMRDIAMHGAKHDDTMIFRVEQRQHLRRLAGLGVLAHQPAIAEYCKTTEEERGKMALCILQQKSESNPGELKKSKRSLRMEGGKERMKIKKANISWTRLLDGKST